jgi:hypothetical protein
VAWQWKAGGAAVSNTQGTITSQVSANPTAGFSVVTFTGNGSTGTIGHGLGVAPKLIIQKPRSVAGGSWAVYHSSIGANNALFLNLTDKSDPYPTVWNNTAPTSSVYSSGSYMGTLTYVAYCFTEIAGFSKISSYTGNGLPDGPFVFCGFRPRFVMVKSSTDATSWLMFDTSRDITNVSQSALFPNQIITESISASYNFDILSNGFKIRNATAGTMNTSGSTYIYAAFAEVPSKYALAR